MKSIAPPAFFGILKRRCFVVITLINIINTSGIAPRERAHPL